MFLFHIYRICSRLYRSIFSRTWKVSLLQHRVGFRKWISRRSRLNSAAGNRFISVTIFLLYFFIVFWGAKDLLANSHRGTKDFVWKNNSIGSIAQFEHNWYLAYPAIVKVSVGNVLHGVMQKPAYGKRDILLSAPLLLMLCNVVRKRVVGVFFPFIILCWQPKVMVRHSESLETKRDNKGKEDCRKMSRRMYCVSELEKDW